MYWDINVTPEDEDEMIRNIAEKIHHSQMDLPAMIILEGMKPLAYIGSQMGRFLVAPFLSVLSDDMGMNGEKFLQVFEKRENAEKLIVLLEGMAKEENKQKKEEARVQKASEAGEPRKKGWRRFLPF